MMSGIGRGPLGGERVLHVGEARLGLVELLPGERDLSAVGEGERRGLVLHIDVGDGGGRPVAQGAVVGVRDRGPELDLITGV
jgi:hypothetical protein